MPEPIEIRLGAACRVRAPAAARGLVGRAGRTRHRAGENRRHPPEERRPPHRADHFRAVRDPAAEFQRRRGRFHRMALGRGDQQQVHVPRRTAGAGSITRVSFTRPTMSCTSTRRRGRSPQPLENVTQILPMNRTSGSACTARCPSGTATPRSAVLGQTSFEFDANYADARLEATWKRPGDAGLLRTSTNQDDVSSTVFFLRPGKNFWGYIGDLQC